ncbi:metal-dependent transcriptional regulator [Schaalia sp. 19OD2882]|uniref:metal-dependent transcriptional regulator n=1 Tax=Schaalia sp. 19OD2882 TaxID=2794089 RepID=UPI001C1E9CA9|nr:metal-dependent transcriptional regulator [Schaalia sp. 19OD2882]QWW19057.1 metal-dependent transcriptional regulator [Schaalia sp. 19OD2882]
MTLSGLSASNQNYVKAVWALGEWSDEPVTASTIAARTGVRLSTASDAIRKLTDQGYLAHSPYGAVELTDQGRAAALELLRRHRLIEAFLVQTLGYGLDEVHAEAEVLEHTVSDLMIRRIDDLLGHPSRDPHGDPIPRADGRIEDATYRRLSSCRVGSAVRVERIADSDPELVRHLAENGVVFGARLRLLENVPYSGGIDFVVESSGDRVSLSRQACEVIRVAPLDDLDEEEGTRAKEKGRHPGP